MSENKSTTLPGIDMEKGQISFNLIKGNLFRPIFADGAFGGIGPRGQMRMTFFSERWPIPTEMVYGLSKSGEVKEEIRGLRKSRDAIVRETEVEIVMDTQTAKTVAEWMLKQISDSETTKNEGEKE